MIHLGKQFRDFDGKRHAEWLRLQKQFAKNRVERERRDQREDRLDEQFVDLAASVIIATEIQFKEFEARLDRYDAVTVEALMENQKELDAVRE